MKHLHHNRRSSISPALICNLYATCLIYWGRSPVLCQQRRPDIRFIWNQAVAALHEDLLLSPGLSSIVSATLCAAGRPITSMTGNSMKIAQSVALAYSLGLNHNPEEWSMTPREKSSRIRAWWGTLVHDWWYVRCSRVFSDIMRRADIEVQGRVYPLERPHTSTGVITTSLFLPFNLWRVET